MSALSPWLIWLSSAFLLITSGGCLPTFPGEDDDAADDDESDDDATGDDDDATGDDDDATGDDDDATGDDDDATGDDDDATGDDDDVTSDNTDHDGDGVSGSQGDCDEGNIDRYPFAWEVMGDGVDNDCDGAVDYADGDAVHEVEIYDDGAEEVVFSDFAFPFCGESWTEVYFIDNGRLTFGGATDSYLEQSDTFTNAAYYPSIAAWWDDFVTSAGVVAWMEWEEAVGFYWVGVQEWDGDGDEEVSLTLLLFPDGRFQVHYQDFEVDDGLVGWSCNEGGSVTETDLTGLQGALPEGSAGLGRGTETHLFELFEGDDGEDTDPGDLAPGGYTFCVQAGSDADGDSWTDRCGDCDDGDDGVYPGHGC